MPEDVNKEATPSQQGRPKARPKRLAVLPPAPRPTYGFWVALAGLYLALVWLDGVGSRIPAKVTPRPWLFFAQVAALFVNAAPKVIDYRAEGWSCSERKWIEIDVRPYFRIDADNKENRFQRALQFYRKNRVVLRALEDFVMKRHAASGGPAIGGVRFASLRIGYPAAGEHISRYERLPLASYSGDQRHDWYWTPRSRRFERCGLKADPSSVDSPRDSSREREDDGDRPRDTDPKDIDP